MNNIRSYGAATKNLEGMFEIHWEINETWFTKLFNKQTEFRFTCSYEEGKMYTEKGYHPKEWFDEEGTLITDVHKLHTMCYLLQVISYTRCTIQLKG